MEVEIILRFKLMLKGSLKDFIDAYMFILQTSSAYVLFIVYSGIVIQITLESAI